MIFILTTIMSIITVYLMIQMMDLVDSMKENMIKVKIVQFISSIPVTVLLNFTISSILTQFTGEGLTAGFANLGSSVLVGIFLPPYLRKRYNFQEMETRVLEERALKAEKKAQKKQKKTMETVEGH